MVGYDTEDRAYCMELTYNYGITSYEEGSGLREFGIYVPDVAASLQAAKGLNYKEADGVIRGPDGYRFRPLQMPEGRSERFAYVLCRVSDLSRSAGFYKEFLGFSDAELPQGACLPEKVAAVSYTSASHPHNLEPVSLVFCEDGIKPAIRPWEGRHAFALNADEVKHLYKKFKSEQPGLILHDADGEPISLQEKLGTLFIFIAKDPEGYELCLVSRETMLPAAVEAVTNYDPKLLDWGTRDQRISEIDAAGKDIEALISQHPAVLFSKEWCPFCRKAKEAFEIVGASLFVKELEDAGRKPLVGNPHAFQDYLAAKTNVGRSVPKAFIKGEFIGGGDDVKSLQASGQLHTLCAAAGAIVDDKVQASSANVRHFENGSQVRGS